MILFSQNKHSLSLPVLHYRGRFLKPYRYYGTFANAILVYFLISFLFLFSSSAFSDPIVSNVSLFDKLDEFFTFADSGIYLFFNDLLAEIAGWYLIWVLKSKIFFAKLGFSVASTVLENFGISDVINAAFSNLDSKIVGFILYLRIPEAFNMILSALIARIVLDAMDV